MKNRNRKLAALAAAILAGVSLNALTTSALQAQYKITVSQERLLNAQNEPQNWLMMNGDYSSQRYSKLTQINRDNVKNLRLAWALALRGMQDVGQNGPENEVHPLIDNGFMYTSDVWDKKLAGVNEFGARDRFDTAPLIAEGKVVIASVGPRGWLAGLDAKTGNELWRWYAVPKPGDPGSETWKDDHNAWKTGGGSIWQTGSYDPATKLTMWGTGNPTPNFDPQFRPGDNLYTNSVVALDIDTGKLVWYFQ